MKKWFPVVFLVLLMAGIAYAGTWSGYGDLGAGNANWAAATNDSLLMYDPDGAAASKVYQFRLDDVLADLKDNGSAAPTTNSKAAAYTVGTDDAAECYGGVIYVTSAATITLCDNLAEDMAVTVITIGTIAVSVDTQADDRMYLDGTALDDGDKATNTSTTGDLIVCTYESAAGWYCASGSPDGDNWTDGGA